MSDPLRPREYTVRVILQARILEWVAFPFSTGSSQPRDGTQSCSVVSDSLRPHEYTVHGILQARILEWVAFPFSRGSSQHRDRTHCRRILYQLSHKGSPNLSSKEFTTKMKTCSNSYVSHFSPLRAILEMTFT